MANPIEEIRAQLDRIEAKLDRLGSPPASAAPAAPERRPGASIPDLVRSVLLAMTRDEAVDYFRSKFAREPDALAAAMAELGTELVDLTCPEIGDDPQQHHAGPGPVPREAREALRRARGGGHVERRDPGGVAGRR